MYSDVNAGVIAISPSDLLYDEDDVYQSILTIFATRVKTRPFRRRFGTQFEQYLFDPITERTAFRISAEIPAAIEANEPRAVLLTNAVVPDYENAGYWISLEFDIPALNKRVSKSFLMSK